MKITFTQSDKLPKSKDWKNTAKAYAMEQIEGDVIAIKNNMVYVDGLRQATIVDYGRRFWTLTGSTYDGMDVKS